MSEEGTDFRFSGIESGATFWYRIGQATSLPKLLLQRTPFTCNPPSLELQLDQLLFGLLESAPYLTTPLPQRRTSSPKLDLKYQVFVPNQCIHLGQNSLYHNSSFPYWDRFQEYPGRWRSLLSCLPTRVGNFLWWVTSLLFGLSSSAKTSLTYYALTYLVLGLIVEIP